MKVRGGSPGRVRVPSVGALLVVVLTSASTFGEEPRQAPAATQGPSETGDPAPADPDGPTKDIFDIIREWRG